MVPFDAEEAGRLVDGHIIGPVHLEPFGEEPAGHSLNRRRVGQRPHRVRQGEQEGVPLLALAQGVFGGLFVR